jgi:hypothetical protein
MKIYRARFSAKEMVAKEGQRQWRMNVTWQIIAEGMLEAIAKLTQKAAPKYTEIELHMIEYLGDVTIA